MRPKAKHTGKKPKSGAKGKSSRLVRKQSTRNQARVPVQIEIQYRVKQKYVVDLTQDISPGGIFIQTPSPLPKGTTVDLQLGRGFPGMPESKDRQLFVEGKVVWSKPFAGKPTKKSKERFGMGIEFTRIDVEGQHFIDSLINDFLRKVSIL